ncbi:hypothetical protein OUZ56_018374 [Daphnia magna]|uniref:Uncharacterized protein n=1 Tax=Daphnia magna TaxID=35525 RepID=A0ABQ9Z8T3_9CRUS|nr:hypothetical protein OUZ56_018374 [Daphnia magna]
MVNRKKKTITTQPPVPSNSPTIPQFTPPPPSPNPSISSFPPPPPPSSSSVSSFNPTLPSPSSPIPAEEVVHFYKDCPKWANSAVVNSGTNER